ATRPFISRPFILKSLMHGLISAIIAIGLLLVVLYFSRQALPELVDLQQVDMFISLFGIVMLLGLVITGFSTLFAVVRYLNLKSYKIH
ncbi:MAG: cell division protein FtsX, partial [Chloroflexota bacterium]